MSEEQRIAKKQFLLHLTDGEMDLLIKKAKSCDMNRTAFLRQLITYGKIIKVVVDKESIDGLKNEINRIGTNINQIAKVVNSERKCDDIELHKLVDAYENLFEIIEEKLMID